MKKRIMLALVVAMVIFGAFYASAANLVVQDAVIQAGLDADMTCDNDGVFVAGWGYESTSQLVQSIRIGGIDSACVGLEMVVQVLGAGNSDLDTTVVVIPNPIPANGVSVSIGPEAAADIEALHVAISN